MEGSEDTSSGEATWVDDAVAGEAPRYDPRTELGRGAMGRVEAVYDVRLDRVVARKTLYRSGRDAEFRREARMAASLEHPGIVPVYEASDGPDGPWYTMRRVEGRTLRSVIADASSVTARLELVAPFLRLCEAIAYAHGKGVVHRDIKPDNVMLGPFGEVVVVDFGLAVRVDEAAAGRIAGTPAYMSPEAARGERPGPRDDVWSLGATLYTLLTGQAPYSGTGHAILEALRDGPSPTLDDATLPAELRAVVNKAMQRDPAQRYPDAEALRADVAAFTNGRLVGAYSYSRAELFWRFVDQYRGYLVFGGISAALVLAVIGISSVQVRFDRDRAVAAEQARTQQLAQSLEARARSLGGAAEAEGVAREALALDPDLPWARGVLAEFASEGRMVVEQGFDHRCRRAHRIGDGVVLECPGEALLLSTDGQGADRVLDRLEGVRFVATPSRLIVDTSSETSRRSYEVRDGAFEERSVWDPTHAPDAINVVVVELGDGRMAFLAALPDVVRVSVLGDDGSLERSHTLDVPRVQQAAAYSDGVLLFGNEAAAICDAVLRDCVPVPIEGVLHRAVWVDPARHRALGVLTTGEAVSIQWDPASGTVRGVEIIERTTAGNVVDIAYTDSGVIAVLIVDGRLELYDRTGAYLGQYDTRALAVRDVLAVDDRFWLVGRRGLQIARFDLPAQLPVVRTTNGIGAMHAAAGSLVFSVESEVFELAGRRVASISRSAGFVKSLAADEAHVFVLPAAAPLYDGRAVPVQGELQRAADGGRRVALSDRGPIVVRYSDRVVLGDQVLGRTVGDVDAAADRWIGEDPRGTARIQELGGRLVHERRFGGELWALALSTDGQQAAVATEDHEVWLLDVESASWSRLEGAHDGPIAGLTFSPSGARLASVSWDGTSRVWEQGALLAALEAHSGRVTTAAFLDEDTLYTGSWDQTLRRWDLSVLNDIVGR
jgi:tRNA A-37 threonylcarbamoyl transferase component Bud32